MSLLMPARCGGGARVLRCGPFEVLMLRSVPVVAFSLFGVLGAVVAADGCGATNPFDPDAPKDLQAKGKVSGVLVVSGCDSAAGVTVALVRDKVPLAQTDALAAGDGG